MLIKLHSSNILYKMAKLAINHCQIEIDSSLDFGGPALKLNCPLDECHNNVSSLKFAPEALTKSAMS